MNAYCDMREVEYDLRAKVEVSHERKDSQMCFPQKQDTSISGCVIFTARGQKRNAIDVVLHNIARSLCSYIGNLLAEHGIVQPAAVMFPHSAISLTTSLRGLSLTGLLSQPSGSRIVSHRKLPKQELFLPWSSRRPLLCQWIELNILWLLYCNIK